MSHERPRRRDNLLERDLGGETLLYDVQGRHIHILNVTGQVVWRLCDGTHLSADIVEALRADFDIAETVDVEGDVQETLATLRRLMLIA